MHPQSSDATSPSKKEESGKGNPRTYLGCMAGTSSALYDLDSDGYGLTSRENIKELVPSKLVDVEEVERGLQEKARFTAQLAGRLFQAMQVGRKRVLACLPVLYLCLFVAVCMYVPLAGCLRGCDLRDRDDSNRNKLFRVFEQRSSANTASCVTRPGLFKEVHDHKSCYLGDGLSTPPSFSCRRSGDEIPTTISSTLSVVSFFFNFPSATGDLKTR